MTRSLIPAFCFLLTSMAVSSAQSAPTMNVLLRMTVIRSSQERGTAFSIDVDNREYWLTAKHILTGAKGPPYGTVDEKSVVLSMLNPHVRELQWSSVTFSVLDPGKDIDIVVLAPPNPLVSNSLNTAQTGFDHVTLGTECEFLGYPVAAHNFWSAVHESGLFTWMPFVKHCYVSSLPDQKTDIVYLDGVNNPGFSGGPVVYKTGPEQKIIAVVSGLMRESAEVVPAPTATHATPSKKQQVYLNSGFIVAYSIDPAIKAIKEHPMGSPRQ